MNKNQSDVGSRYYSGAGVVNLTRNPALVIANREPYTVYGLKVVTDTVIDTSQTEVAKGYDFDITSLTDQVLTPGDYTLRFKKLVFVSGTGFAHLEG